MKGRENNMAEINNGLAAALMGGIQTEQEAPAQEEKPKRGRRKSIIDKEPLPGATGEELKKKRKRAKKDPELRKTHSFTVLMTEQTYQKFKRVALAEEVSMNGIANRLIRKYIIAHDIDGHILDDF